MFFLIFLFISFICSFVKHGKIKKAFESILVRPATRFEKNKLVKYCENQLAVYQQKPALTKETLAIGEFAQPNRKYNEAEAAALMKTILIM